MHKYKPTEIHISKKYLKSKYPTLSLDIYRQMANDLNTVGTTLVSNNKIELIFLNGKCIKNLISRIDKNDDTLPEEYHKENLNKEFAKDSNLSTLEQIVTQCLVHEMFHDFLYQTEDKETCIKYDKIYRYLRKHEIIA